MLKVDRRDFLGTAGAFAAAPLLSGCATMLPAEASGGDGAVQRLLAGIAEDLLSEYPENASALGLDTGDRYALKSRLTDRSLAGRRIHAAAAASRLARLLPALALLAG